MEKNNWLIVLKDNKMLEYTCHSSRHAWGMTNQYNYIANCQVPWDIIISFENKIIKNSRDLLLFLKNHRSRIRHLQINDLYVGQLLTDDILKEICENNNEGTLKTLIAPSAIEITDKGLEYLVGIERLHMEYNRNITNDGLKYLDGGNIKELLLDLCDQITDEGIKHLRGIKKLNLRTNQNITDEGLKNLYGSIEELNLGMNLNITNEGLKNLRGTIQTLMLGGCRNITDDGLRYLQGTIQYLDLENCHMITDDGLKYLHGSIEYLNLRHNQNITNNELRYLSGTIKYLFLGNNDRITDMGLRCIYETIQELKFNRPTSNDQNKWMVRTIWQKMDKVK